MRRVLVLVLVGALSLAGCGDDDGDDDGAGGTLPPSEHTETVEPQPEPATHSFTAGDCTDAAYPVPLSVTTDVAEELQYLDKVVACAAAEGPGVWLSNLSDAVWTVTWDGEPITVDYVDSNEQLFAAAMRRDDVLAPGGSISFDAATPDVLEWHADFGLSVGWVSQEAMLERAETLIQNAAQAALDRRSPVGAAAFACTIAATDLASFQASGGDPFQPVADTFGLVAQGSECVQRLSQVTVLDRSGQQVRLSDDMARLAARNADDFGFADNALRFASNASKVLKFLISLK